MSEFEMVKLMNETTIIYLKKMNESVNKNEKIKQMFENDEAFFFKIPKENALKVLKLVGINNNDYLEEEYNKLISRREFYRLREKGIIVNDDFIVKYEENIELFKKEDNLKKSEEVSLVVKKSIFNRFLDKIKKFFNISN